MLRIFSRPRSLKPPGFGMPYLDERYCGKTIISFNNLLRPSQFFFLISSMAPPSNKAFLTLISCKYLLERYVDAIYLDPAANKLILSSE
jgi:hypothetical protein